MTASSVVARTTFTPSRHFNDSAIETPSVRLQYHAGLLQASNVAVHPAEGRREAPLPRIGCNGLLERASQPLVRIYCFAQDPRRKLSLLLQLSLKVLGMFQERLIVPGFFDVNPFVAVAPKFVNLRLQFGADLSFLTTLHQTTPAPTFF